MRPDRRFGPLWPPPALSLSPRLSCGAAIVRGPALPGSGQSLSVSVSAEFLTTNGALGCSAAAGAVRRIRSSRCRNRLEMTGRCAIDKHPDARWCRLHSAFQFPRAVTLCPPHLPHPALPAPRHAPRRRPLSSPPPVCRLSGPKKTFTPSREQTTRQTRRRTVQCPPRSPG